MIEVAMQLESLDVEPARVHPPYSIRGFEPGDERTWLHLQDATGVYPPLGMERFRCEFDSDPSGRQFFVLYHEEAVATGTAWHGEPLREPDWGRLHWIAVDPSHQRRGLGLQLCRHLLGVLRELGCHGAYLTTGDENTGAIALYRKLGFYPWIRTPQEELFWASMPGGGAPDCL